MRLTALLAAAVLSTVSLLSVGGCSATPQKVERVDASVLPADAKALLSPDAEITSVDREVYAKGTTMYNIHYTLDGQRKTIRWNDKRDTTPTGVFEEPIR